MVDVAMGLLADQRTKWLRDRSEAVQDSSVRKDKAGYAHQQEGAYGLSDLKSAWAAGERRVMTREEAKRKARRTKWIVSDTARGADFQQQLITIARRR